MELISPLAPLYLGSKNSPPLNGGTVFNLNDLDLLIPVPPLNKNPLYTSHVSQRQNKWHNEAVSATVELNIIWMRVLSFFGPRGSIN